MPSEASKKQSPHFLYVVAFLSPTGIQIYRAYSHSAEAKAAAWHLWNEKLKISRGEWGDPVVTEAVSDDKSIPQATLSLSSEASSYTGISTYVPQQVVVEKVYMDNKGGNRLREVEDRR